MISYWPSSLEGRRVGWFDDVHERYGTATKDDDGLIFVEFDDESSAWFTAGDLFQLEGE